MAQRRSREILGIVADLASVISALVIVVLTVFVAFTASQRMSAGQATATAATRTPPARPQPPPVSIVNGVETTANATATRPAGARIAVVEFSDYECQFCGMYARSVYPQLKQEFVDTGRIAYVFRNFPMETRHPLAVKASEAAECAREQGKYWEMREHLFQNQKNLTEQDLGRYADLLRIDRTRFDACLTEGRGSVVSTDIAEGRRLGVRATPTFFIGEIHPDGTIVPTRRIMGTVPYAAFKSVIEEVATPLGSR